MRRIAFLTGTRADFGKIKSLIEITNRAEEFDVHVFATGMHMNPRYGRTIDEILKCKYKNVFQFYNHSDNDPMDMILARTIEGFSRWVNDVRPDLIVLHGDRVEALAGAIVGGLNDILTAHIEGGELSGTIDESIRHAVSKLCHIHLVSNNEARFRLAQMGELPANVHVIGSPDIDIILSKKLPDLAAVKDHYQIAFDKYRLLMFHPVTSEADQVAEQARNLVDAVIASESNYVVIYPNNDKGCEFIFQEYKRLERHPRFRVFPSMRFEYFLVLLKNAQMIVGNSSSGIREAPYYGVPCVDVGSRQNNRTQTRNVVRCGYETAAITAAMAAAEALPVRKEQAFGDGKSDKAFVELLRQDHIWQTPRQKAFRDLLSGAR